MRKLMICASDADNARYEGHVDFVTEELVWREEK